MKRWTNEQRASVRATLAAVDHHYPVQSDGALWTTENPKTKRGANERGYIIAALHLASSASSGASVCPWDTEACRLACLNYSGYGAINLDASGWNTTQAARIRRTARMILFPDAFAHDLLRELDTIRRKAEADGLRLAVRMNATSDISWHRTAPDLLEEVQKRSAVVYDYTKRPKPDGIAAGLDLTYSYPGGQGAAARRYLDAGARIAVVFDTPKGLALPEQWRSPWGDDLPVIDGDASDMRWLDPAGVVVGLRAKGRLVGERGTRRGFLQQA